MCHESTSVALPETIGVPVGTVTLDDFRHTDCFFFFGHNTGTNAPRMLHPLQEARQAPRADHHLQSDQGARARIVRQSAVAGPDAHARRNLHQHAISPGQDRRRHRGGHGHLQGADRSRRQGAKGRQPARAGRRVHRRAHARLRILRRCDARGELARHRSRKRADAFGAGSRRHRIREGEGGHGPVRHGHHAASRGRARRADAHQPDAARRQHRQAGRGHLPDSRPFERAGAAHRRHHGEAVARAARPARRDVRFRAAARYRHDDRRCLRGPARRHARRIHRSRRQLSRARRRTTACSNRRGGRCR